ncbi:DNA-binding protein [Pseudomonas oryzihabitans]|uniref:PPC domain-containing DNA-binding protein n=1 Tax=Pseudomonas oryzihabitans TaxID=47885 RepID=UPI0028942269|nr:DNA-binding protein [Pseudomonas oryzihabitans]MDT3718221.1 DNA-binding protein [Pseudomonas oryzihabitans]
MTEPRRYVSTPSGFLLVLRQGDEVLASLEALMREESIPSATLSGFGFVATARLGFFDFTKGDYDAREFQQLEITGLNGTLAWKDGAPSVHAHASGGDRDFAVVGGHVLGLRVGRGSFEITVQVHDRRLERRLDPVVGANVLQLDAPGVES